jgi:hypothetical protein
VLKPQGCYTPTAPAHPVATDPLPAVVEESALSELLSPELHLAVAFELLHHFKLVEQNRLSSAEELDLIEFLVAQVTLLSFSLVMEEACEAVVAEPHALSPVACEVVESDTVSSSATPTTVWMCGLLLLPSRMLFLRWHARS